MSVLRLLCSWAAAKLTGLVLNLPPPVRGALAAAALKAQKLKERLRQRPSPA